MVTEYELILPEQNLLQKTGDSYYYHCCNSNYDIPCSLFLSNYGV